IENRSLRFLASGAGGREIHARRIGPDRVPRRQSEGSRLPRQPDSRRRFWEGRAGRRALSKRTASDGGLARRGSNRRARAELRAALPGFHGYIDDSSERLTRPVCEAFGRRKTAIATSVDER